MKMIKMMMISITALTLCWKERLRPDYTSMTFHAGSCRWTSIAVLFPAKRLTGKVHLLKLVEQEGCVGQT